MEFEIGDRVISSEVEPNDYGGAYQEKHLEIVEFLDGNRVRCKYFSESKVNPSIDEFIVKRTSLTFVSKEKLKHIGLDEDPFWKTKWKK